MRRDEPIAVVGMALQVPGATTLEEFWQNLRSGRDSITRAEPAVCGRTVYAVGRVEDTDLFDARHFGIPPSEAAMTDPQQRLFLRCAADALDDAGHSGGVEAGVTGVVASVGHNQYVLNNVLAHPDVVATQGAMQLLIGNEKDHMATRVAYRLDLTGPALTTQTSCSSSLSAVYLAMTLLRQGDADTMIAGAASLDPPATHSYEFTPDDFMSPDGYCRAFDEQAAGTVPGSGVVAVVLRRLSSAQASGDTIYAVLSGAAMTNDGRHKVGYTAPSSDGQQAAITAALQDAGITAAEVGYVETHGTGTPLGDAIELSALQQAYLTATRPSPLRIGSLKPNVGHLDNAAGVAALVKAVLSSHHGELPPSLYCDTPNLQIKDDQGIEVNIGLAALDRSSHHIGVSAFGLGGTNLHVIVSPEPRDGRPGSTPPRPEPDARSRHLLTVSATSAEAATRMGEELAGIVASRADLDLADIASTLHHGRRHHPFRSYAVAEVGDTRPPKFTRPRKAKRRLRVGLVFAGHGAHSFAAMRGLGDSVDPLMSAVDQHLTHVGADLAASVRAHLLGDADASPDLVITQIATYVLQAAVGQYLMDRQVDVTVVLGHSLGEYAAATCAEVLSPQSALRMIIARGDALLRAPAGGMLLVHAPADDVRSTVGDRLDIAAINTPTRTVVSGEHAQIEWARSTFDGLGVATRDLAVPVAGHSRLLDAELDDFAESLARLDFRAPSIPLVSTSTGDFLIDVDDVNATHWRSHLRDTVQFSAAVERAAKTVDLLIDVGPGQSMTTLIEAHAFATRALPLHFGDLRLDREVEVALGEVWSDGAGAEVLGHRDDEVRRVPLPPYSYDRESHWLHTTTEGDLSTLFVASPATPAQPSSPMPDDIRASGGDAGPGTQDEPDLAKARTGVDGDLGDLWCAVLGIDSVTAEDNFFALGGESQSLVRLAQLIRERLGVEVTVRQLVKNPTLRRMSECLDEAS